jgi:DNA invertase Pin-like site-specific DNA recombinase
VGNREKRGRFESPDLQREAIDRWCVEHQMTVAIEIFDRNRSGGTLTRPGLQEALVAIRAGEADGIVVARSDRASRVTLDGLGLIDELEKAGAWIVAADGTIDTTDRIRKMATTMQFAMAESELGRFREQSRETHRRAIVDKGRHMGPTPFGYARDPANRLVPHAEHAEWLREIFRRRTDGAGWTAIAGELDAAGVLFATTGGRVTSQQIMRMVKRRVYLGEARHGEWVHENAHPGLVDEALWRAANRARPAVAANPATVRKHPESILRGLPRCSGCRYVMKRLPERNGVTARSVCRTLSGNSATHSCHAPAKIAGREAEAVERHVVASFMALASRAAWDEAPRDHDIEALQRQAADAEALLDELSSLAVRRELGAGRWSRMVAQARDAHEAALQRLAQARLQIRPTGDIATLGMVWQAADTSERHELLCSVIQAVMIDAGERPAVERAHVLPIWESVDLPRKGMRDFIAHPWQPGPTARASQNTSADPPNIR